MKLDPVIYTAHAKSTGGRQGTSRTSDGYVDVKLTMPKEFGGPGGVGTNPEQLFAMGFSACFISTMKYLAALERSRLRFPEWIGLKCNPSWLHTAKVHGCVSAAPMRER